MSVLKVPRGGKRVDTKITVHRHLRTNENDPIGADRVIGIDTESLVVGGKLRTVLTPYSSTLHTFTQEWPTDEENPILIPLEYTFAYFSEPIENPSRVKVRFEKGARESLSPVLWVFYNLEYDIQRLFSPESPFFRLIRQSNRDITFQIGTFKFQFAQINPSGSAPSFHLIVTRDNRAVRIYGMDMWGYWKSGLGNTAKSLNVESQKEDIPSDWFQIPLEQWTFEMWSRFRQYAGTDAKATRLIYHATAELLGSISRTVFNRNGILPSSAPAAAARMAFGMASEKEWRRAPKMFEQMALDGYHGGYVAMLERGKVEGVTVADLHSAYPSAFLLLPDPCRAQYARLPSEKWKQIPDSIRAYGNLGFVRATFTIKSGVRFPSVSEQMKQFTGHQTGRYENFTISLPELSVMFDLAQIDEAFIHDGFIIHGEYGSSFLRLFVQKLYKIKAEEEESDRKNSALYLAAKLLMNALYGKLIEIHEPDLPALESFTDLIELITMPMTSERLGERKRTMAQYFVDGGMALLQTQSANNSEAYRNAGIAPERLQVKELLSDEMATAGAYFMPIYASLTTAITRAKICICMNTFDAIGGDTDSWFHRLLPGTPAYIRAERWANELCTRAGVGGLSDHGGLLGYGVEMVNGTGYVAGIKQYTLSADGYKSKLAHHAITDPPGKAYAERNEFCSNAVKNLANGEAVTYTTRSKPRRLRESLLSGDGQYGVFVTLERTVTPKADQRLEVIGITETGGLKFGWKDRSQIDSKQIL